MNNDITKFRSEMMMERQRLKDNIDRLESEIERLQADIANLTVHVNDTGNVLGDIQASTQDNRDRMDLMHGDDHLIINRRGDGYPELNIAQMRFRFHLLDSETLFVGDGAAMFEEAYCTWTGDSLSFTGKAAGTYYIYTTIVSSTATITLNISDVDTTPTISSGVYVIGRVIMTSDGIQNWYQDQWSNLGHSRARPDGEDSGIAAIDDARPRGKTIGYVPEGDHEGEIEDYNFYTYVLKTTDWYFENDQILSWWKYPADKEITAIEKVYLRLDAEGGDPDPDIPRSGRSLHIEATGGINSPYMQLYEFLGGETIEVDTVEKRYDRDFVIRDRTTAPRKVAYVNMSTFKAAAADYADEAGSFPHSLEDHEDYLVPGTGKSAGAVPVAENESQWDWKSAADYAALLKHTNLDYTDSGTVGTGKSGGNTDHDDAYWHAYNDGVIGHADYVDGKDYRTSGEVGAGKFFVFDDAIRNHWDADSLSAITTGVIDIISEGDEIYLQGLTGVQIWSEAGGYIGLNAPSIKYNSLTGQTIAGWAECGGLIGTDVIEIDSGEIRVTDKILVRRSA